MQKSKTLVLNSSQIQKKIHRMAWEIYEKNYSEKEIIIAGIEKRGVLLAKRIEDVLMKISKIKISSTYININKKNPLQNKVEIGNIDFQNKTIIVVDDVLKSGRTLTFGIQKFINQPIKKIMTCVLVDRNYKKFPVKADVVGMSLSTTMQEHVKVNLGKDEGVYLE